jgi:peptidoglycan/LPS O-acetylase OafA/YrhL
MSLFSFLSKQQQNRVFGLDIMRATAISLVLFGHCYYVFLSQHFPSLHYLLFMDGVDLFFVLSGFLIGSILIKQFEHHEGYKLSIISSFWKRRWMRTLPNYYFVLFLILFVPVVLPFLRGKQIAIPFSTWGGFLIFSQNLFYPQVGFFPEAWSLAVEEWFYLVVPVILWIYFRLFNTKTSKKNILLLLILSILILEIIVRYSVSKNMTDINIDVWDTHIRKVVFTRLDAILYGVFGAFLKFYYPIHWKDKSLFPYLNITGIILLFITNYQYTVVDKEHLNLFMNVFSFSCTSIGVLLLLPQMDSIKSAPPPHSAISFLGKIITHISLISYSLYLIHSHLILGHIKRYKTEFLDNLFPDSPLVGITYFIFYLTFTIVLSTLLYYGIEKPFMNMRTPEK